VLQLCDALSCWVLQGIEDPNVFRRERMYCTAVDEELRKWYFGLQSVFRAYADRKVRAHSALVRPFVCC
jgi:hypothetical protein